MINKLLYKLTARLPCRVIHLDSGPYLERYYLGQARGVTFYLHRFVSSDSERHLHNHPWGWGRALVLSGRYEEESALDICLHASASGCVLHRREVRWWNRVDGNHFHRISNAKSGTWTLFAHGPRVCTDGKPVGSKRSGASRLKGWGFLGGGTFTEWLSADPRWWETAPPGENAGRTPL